MKIEVSFPGGVAVDATVRNHVIHTDQPAPAGSDSGPSPFDVFLASIATCMGFYALRFCQERSLSTKGLGVTLEPIRAVAGGPVTTIDVQLRLPENFPPKYVDALGRAVDHCAVKRHMLTPPEFRLQLVEDEITAIS
ncbi:MAG TPA: OsmC family protein [Thermoanaerobaculia bacterium]|jgi:ribosomal protein S12 methylthiotransferase accessory factor|nr:OsmC family protein [Thermoanaerobaculia bacterium]